jgi:hypothetical protein
MVGPKTLLHIWVCGRGFPTDLPMVGQFSYGPGTSYRRGFPTDLPMVGPQQNQRQHNQRRGFPTDLPMVGQDGFN